MGKKNAKKLSFLGAGIMVKNEEGQIERTLETVVHSVDCIIILDTGSTDKTISVIKRYCNKFKTKVYVHEEPFINFSASRNRLLDLCKKYCKYVVLLDANDELRNSETLKPQIKMSNGSYIFFMRHVTEEKDGSEMEYHRLTCLKTGLDDVKYKGRIHEVLESKDPLKYKSNLLSYVCVYNIRKLDKPSDERHVKDLDWLKEDLQDNPNDPRTLFYLGRTYINLMKFEEAYNAFEERCKLEPNTEETYHALICMGNCAMNCNKSPEIVKNIFMRAYKCKNRAEGPYFIARYMLSKGEDINIAYTYIKKACAIELIRAPHIVNMSSVYEIDRWKLMADICMKMGKIEDVKNALSHLKDYKSIRNDWVKTTSIRYPKEEENIKWKPK